MIFLDYPWHNAPSLAKYAAMDYDGTCYWFENKPELDMDNEWTIDEGRFEQINMDDPEEQILRSLEERPT